MKNIFKNLIPYRKSMLLIFLLLMIQAYCDLSLPTYTSNIIDVGIQNSGIEHITPRTMSADEYELAQVLMTEEEKELWCGLYTQQGDTYERTCEDTNVLETADETLLIPLILSYQMGHVTQDQFYEMLETYASQNPVMSLFADKISSMSIEELGEKLHLQIDTYTTEDSDGESTTYVDVRSLVSSMTAAGGQNADQMAESRDQMSAAIESMGSSTLKSTAIQYVIACENEVGADLHAGQMKYLWTTAGKMAILALLMMLTAVGVSFLASRVGADVGRSLRQRVFSRVMGYSNAEIDRFSSASLITRATNDIQQVQMVSTMMLRIALYAPIMGVGGIIKVLQTGAKMEWIIALAVLVLLGFVLILVSIALPKFKAMQQKVDALNLVSREILTGLPVIRAFGREETEEARFDKANIDLKNTQLFTTRVMTFMMPGMMMIMNAVVVLITWTAAHRIDAGTLQVGAMTAFITYTMQIVISFLMLTAMSIMLPRAGVAAERIWEVLDTQTSVRDADETKKPEQIRGEVRFEHVSFRYPGAEQDVLQDIDFTARPGEVTAIIGSTGSGKSTLINLLPRFFDVTEGRILLDGVDVRELSMKDLRAQIGLVPQKGVLFSGTIASNLSFGKPDASPEELERAAKIAQATEFIEDKELKYESFISQGGRNVSGGQKQRLAIARAIAKDPKVLVFDDSFSALDMKTDAMLRKALEKEIRNCTQIIVAQRISTILHADQILVLDDGRIVGRGTHEELLKNCDVYRQIAVSQLSKKELGLEEDSAV